MILHMNVPAILMFHSLDTSRSPISLEPDRFERLLNGLVERGWKSINFSDHNQHSQPISDQTMILTFDDGLCTIRCAVPILERLGLSATVFLVAGRVGGWNDFPGCRIRVLRQRLLTWSECRELAERGIRFASHGWDHHPVTQLDSETLRDDLQRARERIATELPAAFDDAPFAYPYGDWDRRTRRIVGEFHRIGLGTRLGRPRPSDCPLVLPRIDAYHLRNPCVAARWMGSWGDWWMVPRRSIRQLRTSWEKTQRWLSSSLG